MKNAKDTKVEEMEKEKEKKVDEAAMVKYKDTIDKLNEELEEKQRELDKKDEENKLMNLEVEKLESFKPACLKDPLEQVYNSINKCQVKFDKDFTLDLNRIYYERKQRDAIKMLSLFKLPDIR